MLIVTAKVPRRKLALWALAAAALCCCALFVHVTPLHTAPATETAAPVRVKGIKTNEDRLNFLSQFGWTAEPTPVEEVAVTIPKEFDKVFIGYNELQKQQGLDLAKYKNKDVTRYTYRITNYPDYEGTVYANILVYRGKVVGGDLCSADVNGFVSGFDGKVKLP